MAPYPFDCAPSQRFRFEQYTPILSTEFDIEFIPFIDEKTWDVLYQPKQYIKKAFFMLRSFVRRAKDMKKARHADVIFIHRELSHLGPPIFEWYLKKVLKKDFIYDFDDAIWIPNYSESNALFQRLKAYGKVKRIMKWAKLITAGNEYLADFARHYNSAVQVIPTTIDTNYHQRKNKTENNPVIMGWTGTLTTVHYLQALVPVLEKLSTKYDFKFVLIANKAPDFHIPNLEFIPWKKDTEIEDLAKLDIGVMPLVADQWSSGKCGFKALQYMSLGIPTVLSPVGVNTQIVEHGKNGLLASTPEEWYEHLEQLLMDPVLRKNLGDSGRERIKSSYSVESQFPIYQKIFRHEANLRD